MSASCVRTGVSPDTAGEGCHSGVRADKGLMVASLPRSLSRVACSSYANGTSRERGGGGPVCSWGGDWPASRSRSRQMSDRHRHIGARGLAGARGRKGGGVFACTVRGRMCEISCRHVVLPDIFDSRTGTLSRWRRAGQGFDLMPVRWYRNRGRPVVCFFPWAADLFAGTLQTRADWGQQSRHVHYTAASGRCPRRVAVRAMPPRP